MVKLICEVCCREFEVKPYRKNTAKYCSLRCKGIGEYNRMKNEGYGLFFTDDSYKRGNQFRKGMKPTNAFKPGDVPWNKGVKGLHLSPGTEFKKGHVSLTKRKIGTITQRKDRYGTMRNYVKVADPNSWETYSTFLWKKAYGKIKKGYVVHHKNKNALDDRLGNFILLTRAEHLEAHRDDYRERNLYASKNERVFAPTRST